MHRHGEAEAHIHPRGIGFDGFVNAPLEPGKAHDRIEPLPYFPLREAKHYAVDEDILAAAKLRVEASSQLQQSSHLTIYAHFTPIRAVDACQQLQQRALP